MKSDGRRRPRRARSLAEPGCRMASMGAARSALARLLLLPVAAVLGTAAIGAAAGAEQCPPGFKTHSTGFWCAAASQHLHNATHGHASAMTRRDGPAAARVGFPHSPPPRPRHLCCAGAAGPTPTRDHPGTRRGWTAPTEPPRCAAASAAPGTALAASGASRSRRTYPTATSPRRRATSSSAPPRIHSFRSTTRCLRSSPRASSMVSSHRHRRRRRRHRRSVGRPRVTPSPASRTAGERCSVISPTPTTSPTTSRPAIAANVRT